MVARPQRVVRLDVAVHDFAIVRIWGENHEHQWRTGMGVSIVVA